MTAFHITLVIIILVVICFFIYCYNEGFPCDIDDWVESIMITCQMALMVAMVIVIIGAIYIGLTHVDWYGFFHDKVI